MSYAIGKTTENSLKWANRPAAKVLTAASTILSMIHLQPKHEMHLWKNVKFELI